MKTIKPSNPETRQPFEKFERLTKALMAVPKNELDKEQAKHERAKQSKRKAASNAK